MIRILFGLILIMGLCSCGSKSQDKVVPNVMKAVNEAGVTAAQTKLCKSDEALEEVQILDTQKIYYDFSNFALFGFANGTQKCALTTDYNQNAVWDSWYSVTLPDNCIVNGSLWELKSISRQDNQTIILLKEFDSAQSTREIKIHSGYSVGLKDLSTSVGMHFLKCMPKNQK